MLWETYIGFHFFFFFFSQQCDTLSKIPNIFLGFMNKKIALRECYQLKKCCSNTWTKNIGLKAQSIVYDPNF